MDCCNGNLISFVILTFGALNFLGLLIMVFQQSKANLLEILLFALLNVIMGYLASEITKCEAIYDSEIYSEIFTNTKMGILEL
jgi:hypothetical protein